jgi:hypothetical protein
MILITGATGFLREKIFTMTVASGFIEKRTVIKDVRGIFGRRF